MISWFEMYKVCYYHGKMGEISDLQRKNLSEIEKIASVQRAIDYRFYKSKAIKNRNTAKSTVKRTYPHSIYIDVAQYYELYYNNGTKLDANLQPPVHTVQDYVDHARTRRTKHKNYIHSRNDTIIEELRASTPSYTTMSDDEFIMLIYSQSPKYAFSYKELDAWSEMYIFATTAKVDFRFVKRSDRRSEHINNGTFREIAEEYREEFELYSCKERFFIPLFSQTYTSMSKTALDRLLRYGSDPKCFTDADLEYIKGKVGKSFDVDDFFYTIDVIRKMSKKKQP